MAAPNPKILKEVQAYLAEKKALILDPSSSSRPAIRKLMTTLGVKTANVDIVETYKEADEYITKNKPEIVWCEYELTKGTGLELFEAYKKIFPSRLTSTYILLSEKNSPSIASQAAEDDVDSFVVRPFTFDGLQTKFLEIIRSKIAPTDYNKLIETAKAMIETNPDEALKLLEKAKTLDKKPSLACYYVAQAHIKANRLNEAEASLMEGLKHTPDHYKCLSGGLEFMLTKKDNNAAYALGQKLFEVGPINPKYIPKMIWLSIFNKKYDDILAYQDLLIKIENPDEQLINSLSAGLIIYGKFLLQENSVMGAIDSFKKADTLSKSKASFMKEIILSLLKSGSANEAQQFISRASEEVKNSKEILLAEFENTVTAKKHDDILQIGLRLLKSGIQEAIVHENVLRSSVEMKRSNSVIEDLLSAAAAAHPDKKAFLKKLLKMSRLSNDFISAFR